MASVVCTNAVTGANAIPATSQFMRVRMAYSFPGLFRGECSAERSSARAVAHQCLAPCLAGAYANWAALEDLPRSLAEGASPKTARYARRNAQGPRTRCPFNPDIASRTECRPLYNLPTAHARQN